MAEEPKIPLQLPVDNSNVFGVSMRAWVALLIIGTVCIISAATAYTQYRDGKEVSIEDPLYGMGLVALGYLFGQKSNTNT
jgi:hypothetical protein